MRDGLFSRFYDASLERLYREARASAVTALSIAPGHVVLDVPCGTGQSLNALIDAVGANGRVVGVDRSAAMPREARRRIEHNGWSNVSVEEGDAGALDDARIPVASFDRLHVFLGMSVFYDPERVMGAARSVGFERHDLPSKWQHGGTLFVASANKPQ